MPSLRSRLLVGFLRATKRKAPYLDVSLLRRRIAEERRTVGVLRDLSLEPRSRSGSKKPGHLLFLHGGCYVFELTPQHRRFCQAIADALGCKVSVPVFPLAPESDALATQAHVRAFIDAHGPFDAWMGDSAGGGLALALAQQMEAAPPLVLLSPWLDAAMENPEILAVDARDPWLSRLGLQECARMYAGELSLDDPRVSPIHGSLAGIPNIAMFIGTRDVFLPDARLFQKRAPEKVTLTEYPEMVHDFMLLRGIPESRKAFWDIVRTLENWI